MSLELILAIVSTITGVISAFIAYKEYKRKHHKNEKTFFSRQPPQINNQSISPIHNYSLYQGISNDSVVNNQRQLNDLEITKAEIVKLTGINIDQTFKDFRYYMRKNSYGNTTYNRIYSMFHPLFSVIAGIFFLYYVYLYTVNISKINFSHINLKEEFGTALAFYVQWSSLLGVGISRIREWKEFNKFIQRQLSQKESIVLGIIAELVCVIAFIIYFVKRNLTITDAVKLVVFFNPFVMFVIPFFLTMLIMYIPDILLDYIYMPIIFNKRKRKYKLIKLILQEIKQYNKLIEDIKVIDKLRAVGNEVNLNNREQVIEALSITRSDLIRALKTERILREHPNFKAENFQVNLNALNALKVSQKATEYANILDETLQIAVSVQQEMNKLQFLP
ncbi:hypothetical protein NIES2100_15760 [Calothrix sp. NIES-2100]|uniref:hypothetical protein n=1 Tax=Calothrix sp. NIES-2100 TaxID=1954172 RepID=UPI000B60F5CB|nr:hypothetical protein NIES2100_15760 [Calothrix sp. NIES-2100]